MIKKEKRKNVQNNLLKIWERVKNGESMAKIGLDYNCSRETIGHELRKNNLKAFELDTRTYKANDNFFKEIDSEIKAYLLGFFYADGTITTDNRLCIRLSQKDVEVLELYRSNICPEKNISENLIYNSPSSMGINRKPQCHFRFKSLIMIEHLKQYNIVNNKTLRQEPVLQFIPDNMKPHFIRGFMDGDGSINKGRFGVSFACANYIVVKEIIDYLKLHNIVFTEKKYKNKSDFWAVGCWNGENCFKFLSLIYKDYQFCLKRKEQNALEQMRRYREGCKTNSLCNA